MSKVEYFKQYKRAQREVAKGTRDSMVNKNVAVEFKTKKISVAKFKKNYKDKLTEEAHVYLFNSCLDLIDLINSAKECLEKEGAYIKGATGALKVNPAQKELRENLKIFSKTLFLLDNLLNDNDEIDLNKWLEED